MFLGDYLIENDLEMMSLLMNASKPIKNNKDYIDVEIIDSKPLLSNDIEIRSINV